jgi:hypothetical protein
MDKKVPKVFANKIDHELKNNENIYYSFDRKENKPNKTFVKGTTIMQKIRSIFKAPNFVYKAKVEIVTDEGVVKKEIVGYNKNYIMTLDDEIIPINKIKDIYFSK